jgi:hypothetical protein
VATENIKYAGIASIAGGILGVMLAPIMVMVKYLTGWSVIPEPGWIDIVQPAFGSMLTFASPPVMWVVYGGIYTIALLLMLTGLLPLWKKIKTSRNRTLKIGYWIFITGLCLIIPGDAVHTMTWHQNGLTKPTPGTNPVANTGYAVAMMGMNFILIGSLMFGITAVIKKILAPWLAWSFILITPSAILLSLTLLPTTPSGGLWFFSLIMIILGYNFASGRFSYLPANNIE